MSATYETPKPNIFDLEKDVITTLNKFNSTYAKFIRCSSSSSVVIDKSDCPSELIDPKNAYDDVNAAIQKLSRALAQVNSNVTSSGPITPQKYNETYDKIMRDYGDLTILRADLDLKMKNLERDDESLSQMYKDKTNATVYASTLWTILASSLIYYVFVKL
jgi:hypothetical protein